MIDFTAVGAEAVDLLRTYLKIDTTNPPGNEIAGARFLADVLARAGIESRTVESAPGRANLVARVRGDGSLGAVVLHHHIDVVYADRRFWTVDPFGGEVRDGFLYGRGAVDMKSTGILQLAALLALARAGVRLKRDLIFLATADEEAGSAFGAQFIAATHPDWLAGAEYALTELGGIEIDPDKRAPIPPFARASSRAATGRRWSAPPSRSTCCAPARSSTSSRPRRWRTSTAACWPATTQARCATG